MSTQRHIIKRQVIELRMQGIEQPHSLQNEISRIYRQRILPLIDKCLTDLSDPDRIYRIDSLDLDIGQLDMQHLEGDLVEKVNLALRRELAAEIDAQERETQSSKQDIQKKSQLELFEVFVRTGSLPWWVDKSRPDLLAENLQYLLSDSPEALGELVTELAREPQSRHRLVNQYDDDQLFTLVELLVPAFGEALARILRESKATSSWQAARDRKMLWRYILEVASLGGNEYANFSNFYRAVLSRLPTEMDFRDTELTESSGGPGLDPAKSAIQFPEAPPTVDELPDELYIENAGLVILWPFLENFFVRVGLLENKQFKNRPAQQRGVGLLQTLATKDPTSPEFLLPLNKILCGLEVTHVFDFGAPLLEAEAEECERLLQAVIAQAPILGDMTTEGLRGTFLLRSGMLSVRDGFWLLRVEKETYDIVLDRFPWSWEWVKLPWMDAPLRVEW
jgi:hypothetical protein